MSDSGNAQIKKVAAKSSGIRGISFPSMGLKEAIERAHVFYNHERKNKAPVSSAVAHWGYGQKSSGGRVTVSALLQFGLFEDEGQKDDRLVRLTTRALDILLAEEGSPTQREAIRAAASSPKIYKEILDRWPSHELPSDATLKSFLLREKDFNPSSVEQFIRNFRETILFAGLTTAPESQQEDQSQDPALIGKPDSQGASSVERANTGEFNYDAGPRTTTKQPAIPQTTFSDESYRQDIFALDEGSVTFIYPRKISKDSFDDLNAWVEILLRKIRRTVDDQA